MYNCLRKNVLVLVLNLLITTITNGQIVADFSSSNTDACGSLKVDFYDQSTVSAGSNIISWEWELGDALSSKQNPGAIFAEPGSITICLTVTDNNGNSNKVCKENYINIYPDPVADFTLDNITGCSPATINITDLSQTENGQITRWIWDVGGSANVIDTNNPMPTISTTYDVQGKYSLSLTVFDEKGCSSTNQKKDIIEINEFIPPDIDYTLITSCSFPWEVQFHNLSADPETDYTWNFGNGESYQGAAPPLVEYSIPGTYDLSIITKKGECIDTTFFPGYIDAEKENDIQIDTELVCVGSPIIFEDVSPIFADSLLWIFGDGTTSTEEQPTHTFNTDGCFLTTLVRYRSDCTDTIVGQCIEVFPQPTITYSIDNQFTCGVPTELILNGSSTGEGAYAWHLTGENLEQSFQGASVPVTISEFGNYNLELVYTDNTGCIAVIEDIDLEIIPYSVQLPSKGPSGCIPLNAVMTDSVRSSVPINSWEWGVYDNDSLLFSSTESSPSFEIQNTGKYNVQLIVENIYGCKDTVYRNDYIEAGTRPMVDFMATPLQSCINDLKEFFDLSGPSVNSWHWNFGDSTFSRVKNPEKMYNQPGVYDVTLTAYHNGCGSTEFKSEYIVINEPRAAFNINYNCDNPHTVELLNRSVGADTLLWSIAFAPGDTLRLTDSLLMPLTFPDRGKYLVQLYNYNDSSGCENTFIDTISITDPVAGFAMDTLSGCAPLELMAFDSSIDAVRYLWIGEGASINRDTFFDPQFTYSSPGIFQGPHLSVVDIHGCSDTIQFQDSIVVNDINASATFDQIVCVPGSFVPVTSSSDIYGSINSFKWQINDSLFISTEKNPVFTIDTPMVYDLKLTVVDDWNCSDSIDYPLAFEGVELIPDFTADTLSCTWSSVRFRAKNTTPNVDSFYWDFGDGNYSTEKNPNYTYSTEGQYSICLSMIDKRGCEQIICKDNYVTIQDPKAEFIGDSLSANCPPLLSNFNNLSSNVNTYFWDFGDNSGNSTNASPSHVYTEPGFYDVTLIVTMNQLCTDTITKIDYVKLEGPTGNFSQEMDSTCIPLNIILSAQSDDLYTYIYDYGNGELDSLTSKVSSDQREYEYTQVGRYVPKIIIVDEKGCTRAIAGDPVYVNSIDLDFAIIDTTFCSSPATVNIENMSISSSGNIAYEWLINGPQIVVSNDPKPIFSIDSMGIYDVSLIARSENCIDTLTKQNSIEITNEPEVGFRILNDQLCDEIIVNFENTTTISSGLITSYLWDFGDGNISEEANPQHIYNNIQSYTISLTANTRNGCSSSFQMELPVSPSTVGNAGPDDTICIGDNLRLKAEVENLQEGGGYYWLDDNSLSCTDCLDPLISPTTTTMYTFVAVHPNGCESIDSVLIAVVPLPGPTSSLNGDTTICLGDEALVTVENYDTNFVYFWEVENGTLDCVTNCETVSAKTDDTTSFYVTVENEYGCVTKDTFTVYVETEIGNIAIEDKTICAGDTTTISVINGQVASWDISEGLSCNDCPEPKVYPIETTYYYVNVLSNEGCHYRDSLLINVIPPESIDAGIDSLLCLGENMVLSGVGIGMPSWFAGDTSSENIGNMYDIAVSPEDTTLFILKVIEGDCTLTDSVIVNIIESAEIESVGDTICYGETAVLTANTVLIDRFWWELPDGTKITNEIEITTIPDSTDTYLLIGQLRTCKNDTSSIQVVVHDEIEAQMEKFFKVYANEDLQFDIFYDETRNYTFDWDPQSGLSCQNCPNPYVLDITSNMNYTVFITDDDSGCQIEEEVMVRFINECTSSVFFMPNVFSPNQDGTNDNFYPFTQNHDEFLRIHVFDRWGNKVYYSENLEDGWDGTFKGDYLLPGVYTYRVDAYCDLTGEEYYFFGDVTLIR